MRVHFIPARRILSCLAEFVAIAIIFGCNTAKQKLLIFHAGSLASPFEWLEKEFEAKEPKIDVLREASGSIDAVKKVTELGRIPDIVASADYTVIEELMFSEYADWDIKFARNEMVIAYTEKSKYKAEINKSNWYEILQRKDVEWGHSDPNQDPCGYRTLLVLQLAEIYYKEDELARKLIKSCPRKNIRPKEVELIALLEKGELDYAFEYHSVAIQHNLKFVELPDELNLGSELQDEFYKKAQITLADGTLKLGELIIYGITIPKNASNKEAAVKFVKLLLSDKGREIMEKNGHPSIFPAIAINIKNVPQEIREMVVEK